MGRRVKKTVYDYNSGAWSLTSESLFIYDGWNLIQESTTDNGQPTTDTFYVWGLDISQSLHGAGGVGGLLTMVDDGTAYNYFYDANGNVGQLVKASDGTIAAQYQYDPFGKVLYSSGPMVNENPFRFSTKHQDDETGLVWYGFRFYAPNLGRWINRDPSEEQGGFNLYTFAKNDPVDLYDLLGLTTVGEILDSFFSESTDERLWLMDANDEYTRRVRNWQPVNNAIQVAKGNLEQNCKSWEKSHKTDPSWTPGRTDPPITDPNAWPRWVSSPPGTDPVTCRNAYVVYYLTGLQINSLWTGSIGSFGIYVTVDKADCCEKTATVRIWMYNAMDRKSFGRFADHWFFRGSGMARQYMWWNWTEEYNWGETGDNGQGGS